MKRISISTFKKGYTPWNKNQKMKWPCQICGKLIDKWKFYGLQKTCCKKHKIELIKQKRAKQIITKKHKKAISQGLKGKSKSKEHIAKISGSNNYHWKGGSNNPLVKLRGSFKYNEWRKAVYRRDYWTCQLCGKKGGEIWADHIKPFALYPELRFDINNGRTICKGCALKLSTHGSKVFNTVIECK